MATFPIQPSGDPRNESFVIKTAGLDPVTGAVIITSILSFGDFLDSFFGGGHTGSCGAFRDAYGEITREILPDLQAFATSVRPAIQNVFADIGTPYSQYLNTAIQLQQFIDDGFDEHRGSNLLGQTMLTARLNQFLFRFLFGPMMFTAIDYTIAVRNEFLNRTNANRAQINDLRNRMNQNAAGISQLRTRLNAIDFAISQINSRITDTISLVHQESVRLHALLGQLIAANRAEITDIVQNRLPEIMGIIVTVERQLLTRIQRDVAGLNLAIQQAEQRVRQLNTTTRGQLELFASRVFSAFKVNVRKLNPELADRLEGFNAGLPHWIEAMNTEITDRRNTDLASVNAAINAGDLAITNQLALVRQQLQNQIDNITIGVSPQLTQALAELTTLINTERLERKADVAKLRTDLQTQTSRINGLASQMSVLLNSTLPALEQRLNTNIAAGDSNTRAFAVAQDVLRFNTLLQEITGLQATFQQALSQAVSLLNAQIVSVQQQSSAADAQLGQLIASELQLVSSELEAVQQQSFETLPTQLEETRRSLLAALSETAAQLDLLIQTGDSALSDRVGELEETVIPFILAELVRLDTARIALRDELLEALQTGDPELSAQLEFEVSRLDSDILELRNQLDQEISVLAENADLLVGDLHDEITQLSTSVAERVQQLEDTHQADQNRTRERLEDLERQISELPVQFEVEIQHAEERACACGAENAVTAVKPYLSPEFFAARLCRMAGDPETLRGIIEQCAAAKPVNTVMDEPERDVLLSFNDQQPKGQ